MSSDITIKRDVAERFIKAMDSLTDCMAASYALHIEIKASIMCADKPIKSIRPIKPLQMPMARECGCYMDEWSKFVTCFDCYQKRND